MSPPVRILLATDGSGDAALAARAAVDLSRAFGAKLHVVHAWHSIPSTRFEAFITTELGREAERVMSRQLETLESECTSIAGNHLRYGSKADEILDCAEELEAAMIVIGSRGFDGIKRLALGSVSGTVALHSKRPVLVLRGNRETWPPERIVIGDDGSEAARHAGELTASIGAAFDTETLLLRIYPRLPRSSTREQNLDPRLVENDLQEEKSKLEERAAELGKATGTRIKARLDVGDPAEDLFSAANEQVPDKTLMVVGSRGLGMMQRLRLGSVSTRVLRTARGPVLIHPGTGGIL